MGADKRTAPDPQSHTDRVCPYALPLTGSEMGPAMAFTSVQYGRTIFLAGAGAKIREKVWEVCKGAAQ